MRHVVILAVLCCGVLFDPLPLAAHLLPMGVTGPGTLGTQSSADAERQAILAAARSLTADSLADLRRNAEAGRVVSQLVLGVAYANGFVVSEDSREAFAWFLKAAEQGRPLAQEMVAQCYATGEGVARDPAKAAVYLRMAAEQGFAPAQTALGTAYAEGTGVARDPAAAVAWYRKAAEQGDASAQVYLADAYDRGDGVRLDHAEAARWLRKAADQGNPDAQFNLAMALYTGEGVRKDRDESEALLSRASEHGYAAASFYLAKLADERWGSVRFVAVPQYLEKAARQGYALAALARGRLSRDKAEAYTWFLVAAALERGEEWRTRWAVYRPIDAEQLRRELPKRLEETRRKLSPQQIDECAREAETFMKLRAAGGS